MVYSHPVRAVRFLQSSIKCIIDFHCYPPEASCSYQYHITQCEWPTLTFEIKQKSTLCLRKNGAYSKGSNIVSQNYTQYCITALTLTEWY